MVSIETSIGIMMITLVIVFCVYWINNYEQWKCCSELYEIYITESLHGFDADGDEHGYCIGYIVGNKTQKYYVEEQNNIPCPFEEGDIIDARKWDNKMVIWRDTNEGNKELQTNNKR